VLTDGGVYYSERGEELKRFLIRDGRGVERLKKLASERLLGREYWVAASCHSDREVEQAMRIGVDFVMISPVYETRSHPAAPSLGWHGFAGLVERSKAPAYALGGGNLII
jgi:thiamine monophosphate synthase